MRKYLRYDATIDIAFNKRFKFSDTGNEQFYETQKETETNRAMILSQLEANPLGSGGVLSQLFVLHDQLSAQLANHREVEIELSETYSNQEQPSSHPAEPPDPDGLWHRDPGYVACISNVFGSGTLLLRRAQSKYDNAEDEPSDPNRLAGVRSLLPGRTACIEADASVWGVDQLGYLHSGPSFKAPRLSFFSFYYPKNTPFCGSLN